jgi:nucleoid DNA-binding protein
MIAEMSKRSGITKKDLRIFFQYFKEFIGDAVESNANVLVPGFFKLSYRVKNGYSATIKGEKKTVPPLVLPQVHISRRLQKKGVVRLTQQEYELLTKEN